MISYLRARFAVRLGCGFLEIVGSFDSWSSVFGRFDEVFGCAYL